MDRSPTQPCPLIRRRLAGNGVARADGSSGRGFTLIELLLVVGITAVLVGIALPAIAAVRRSSNATACLSNLRQIALGFQQYAMTSGGALPDPFIEKKSWEAMLLPYVDGPKAFVCAADAEVAPAFGSSYDWRDTGKVDTSLAGRVLVGTRRPEAVLAFDALPGWHGKRRINAVSIDGSARAMDEKDCFEDLAKPIW